MPTLITSLILYLISPPTPDPKPDGAAQPVVAHRVETAAGKLHVAADVDAHDVGLVELDHHLARLVVDVALLVLRAGEGGSRQGCIQKA